MEAVFWNSFLLREKKLDMMPRTLGKGGHVAS